MTHRLKGARGGLVAGSLLAWLGGCQLISGLSGLPGKTGGTGGEGGATSSASSVSASSSSGMGGAASTSGSGSGSGGAATSSSGGSDTGGAATTSSSSSGTSSASSSGCSGGSMTDPVNCGACGHDCGAGACTMGVCQPYDFVTVDGGGPVALGAANDHVYWADGNMPPGAIWHKEVGSGGVGTVVAIASGANVIRDLVAGPDGVDVYWIEDDGAVTTIQHGNKDAVAKTVFSKLIVSERPIQLRLVDQALIWGGNGFFAYAPLSQVPPTSQIHAVGALEDRRFGVDGQTIFWASDPTMYFLPLGGGMSGGFDTMDEFTWIEADANPAASGFVYWITADALRRTPKASPVGNIKELAKMRSTSGRLLVTDKHLYWTDAVAAGVVGCQGDFNLNRLSLANTAIVELAIDTHSGCPLLAQDAKAVYWSHGAVIRRMVKP